MRYTTSMVNVVEMAHPAAETVKSTAEMNIVGLRPRRSLMMPATLTPAMDPMRAQPTYHPWFMTSRLNCRPTWSMVPDITAVS